MPKPCVELVSVEIIGVLELGAEGCIETDPSFALEELPDFVSSQLLGGCSLTQEEPLSALDRFVLALPNGDHEDAIDGLHQHLHRRVAVAGDVLYLGPQVVRVVDAHHAAVVPNAQQNPASSAIGHGDHFPGKPSRQPLLELQHGAFALLEEDIDVGSFDRHHISHMPAIGASGHCSAKTTIAQNEWGQQQRASEAHRHYWSSSRSVRPARGWV